MSSRKPIPILVTRSLTGEQLSRAAELGLEPLIVPAIRVGFPAVSRALVRRAGLAEHPVWVFTSRNGVEGFIRSVRTAGLSQVPERLYAVGEVTADRLREEGYDPIVPLQQDAIGLSGQIIDDLGEDGRKVTVIHWCGNRRRPELGEHLHRMKVPYVPVEVYQTHLNRMVLPDREVGAMLFYSPSAVEAFRKSDGFSGALPELFAIGHTTAEALSLESGAHVHVPVQPATDDLLELVADVLGTRPIAGQQQQ